MAKTNEHTFEIHDQGEGDGKLKIRVTSEGGSLNIYPEGYGDCGSADGHGVPVLLELWEGRLRVVVFADINEQDPQIIDMEAAKEGERTPEQESLPSVCG